MVYYSSALGSPELIVECSIKEERPLSRILPNRLDIELHVTKIVESKIPDPKL